MTITSQQLFFKIESLKILRAAVIDAGNGQCYIQSEACRSKAERKS